MSCRSASLLHRPTQLLLATERHDEVLILRMAMVADPATATNAGLRANTSCLACLLIAAGLIALPGVLVAPATTPVLLALAGVLIAAALAGILIAAAALAGILIAAAALTGILIAATATATAATRLSEQLLRVEPELAE